MSRALALALVACSLIAAGSEALAKKRRGTAIFPIVSQNQSVAGAAHDVEAALIEKAKAAGIAVTAGKALKRRLRDPVAVARKCAGSAPCLAKLGRRARVAKVVVGTATPTGNSVIITIQVVDTMKRRAIRSAEFELVKKKQVSLMVSAYFADIFGIEDKTVDAELALPDLADPTPPGFEPLALEPPPGVPPPTSPSARGSKPDIELPTTGQPELELTREPSPEPLMTDPDTSPNDPALTAPIEPPAKDPEVLVSDPVQDGSTKGNENWPGLFAQEGPTSSSTAPDKGSRISALDDQPSAKKSASGPRALMIGGIALGGAGVVAIGIGTAFGVMRNDLDARANARDSSGIGIENQTDAQKLADQGSAYAGNANILYGIGGAAVVIGGLMIALDLLSDDSSDKQIKATAGPTQVGLRIVW